MGQSVCPSVSTRDFLQVVAKTFTRWQVVHCGSADITLSLLPTYVMSLEVIPVFVMSLLIG